LMASATVSDPQSWNRYAYVGNNPMVFSDPSGLSRQPGGRNISNWNGAMATEEATDGISPWPDVPDYAPASGTKETDEIEDLGKQSTSDEQPQITVNAYSDNSTMVVAWAPVQGVNPSSAFGHISYITMQNDTSYSWPLGILNLNEWGKRTPSSVYTNVRSQDSAGIGYVLDFGSKINAKFQFTLIHAYDKQGGGKHTYGIWNYNCGRAFNAAINAIRGDLRRQFGVNLPRSNGHRPSTIEKYIQNNLRRFTRTNHEFRKH
jgi:hypothetical protein